MLRVDAAITLICAAQFQHDSLIAPMLSILAVCLAIGIFLGAMLAPCCIAAAGVLLALARITGSHNSIPTTVNVLHFFALACLGAGAYSVDAILHGRRLLIRPKGRKRPF